jgi:HEAT repeat protein
MLPQAADQLVPRLCDRLRRADLSEEWPSNPSGILSALARLGDPTTLPVVTETLGAAAGRDNGNVVRAALEVLRALGPAAAPALARIRSMSTAEDIRTRSAVVAALWTVGGDPDEVMPLALALLDTSALPEAADVLGRIGPPAAAALPRFLEVLPHGHESARSSLGRSAGGASELSTATRS